MRCACSRADITPEPGVQMSGYVARRQPSTGVHDPLSAYALYLEDGGSRLLWLHADVIAFERPDVQRLKSSLAERHGLAAHEVMVTATHTHSGPATVDLLRCGDYEPDEVARIFGCFESLTDEVMASSEPVEMLFAEGSSDLGRHRRPSDHPHTDPRLPVLGFRRSDGTYAAVLALYAMHNVALGGENTLLSADMAGRAARTLSDALPGNPTVLWVNGACGDVNPPAVTRKFEHMEEWGDALAGAARSALDAAAPVPDTSLRSTLTTLSLALDQPGPDAADAILAEQKRRTGSPSSPSNAWVFEACHAAMDAWRARMASDDPAMQARCAVSVDVHVVRLGGAVWVGVGGEVFSILNDELCSRTGENIYVVGYANGAGGYLCPHPAYVEGSYEPDGAFIFYGTNPIPRGAYERVRDTTADLISRDL